MEKCMRCKHEIILEGNFMLSEINGEELNEDDDTMVTYAHCPYCGARYELTDTPESEKRNYPYWNSFKQDLGGQFSRLEHQAYTLGVGGSSPSPPTLLLPYKGNKQQYLFKTANRN